MEAFFYSRSIYHNFVCYKCNVSVYINNQRDHYSAILANLVLRPDTVDQSIQLLTRQVNPRGDCSEFIKDSFCTITSFLFPWFAAQSRTDVNYTSSSEQLVKVEQAKMSHAFLVSTLTQEVRIIACYFLLRILTFTNNSNTNSKSSSARDNIMLLFLLQYHSTDRKHTLQNSSTYPAYLIFNYTW